MRLAPKRIPHRSPALVCLLAVAACSKPAPSEVPPVVPPSAEPAPPPVTPTLVEDSTVGCPAPPLPPLEQLPPVAALPDPFLMSSGQRIASKAEWACRRAEIAAQVQEYELGPKPPRPSIVTGAFDAGQLTVTAGEPGRTVSFAVGVTRPDNAPAGPIPALITIGARSALIPEFAKRGVAIINFDNNSLGAQGNQGEGAARTNTRGQGKFYELYGSDHGASSMMAWAWGVSRVIDALAATPAAGIDVEHLAVTGCSRNGKGALVVGAFDERIALTVPQESGAGGSASWRISQAQMDRYRASVNPNPRGGEGVQTLASASGEQPWFRASFNQFGKSSEDVTRLPFDHHMLLGMAAPRGVFVLDNTDMMWLGDESSFTSAVAAAEIWAGLGAAGAMGASQVGGHPHCTEVPQAQLDELGAFIDRFLLGRNEANTAVLRSDRVQPDRARWITWATPTLK
ncbi:MAG TPA: hypothetical protein VNN80_25260 [Polyangiaceae bacterium]|nr:hypothetical protein [Polyangiaceae bacterium]